MHKKDQHLTNILAGYVSELKDMLNGLAIESNNDVFVTADKATVINADACTVASLNGEWLPDSIFHFVVQHFQSQLDPKGDQKSLRS